MVPLVQKEYKERHFSFEFIQEYGDCTGT